MNGSTDFKSDSSEYVEIDPTGRYGRYNDVLGRGASKTVYRAFDEYEGIEVAWNQVRVHDFLQSPKDLERIYCEIHLLKTLKHRNIMKFYTSWVDTSNKQINFITEMFTSGTLRQYRLKHKRVSIRAVKHWCRQILEGLLYLHSHDPPVIHRDLKCDNIFINGNQGEVKIGDLGLAAILCNSHVAHCVGTPEFMAPEVYGQEYNELVDIYSFGMCILEMVTFEYPYSECTNPAHIYKKVTSGKRPDALYKVQDPEVRQFIEKCLATVPSRLSARELLDDPFLQTDDFDRDFRSIDCKGESDGIDPLIRQPFVDPRISDCSYRSWNCNSSEYEVEPYNEECHNYPVEVEASGVELVDHRDEIEHAPDMDITMKGTRREDGNIFLRLRIADKEGQFRNIYFPFDVEIDTALDVATEMVAELDITDQDVTYIAEMIDEEISKLVPEWKSGPEIEEEDLCAANTELCLNCDSSQTSFASCMKSFSSNPGHCSNGCPANAVEVEGDKLPTSTKQQIAALEHSEKWDCQESVDISSLGSGISHSDDDHKKSDKLTSPKHEIDGNQNEEQSYKLLSDDFENDFQWEMRWLKAKLQLELREIMDQQLRIPSKCSSRQKAGRDQQFSTSDQNSLAMSLRSDSVLTSSDFRSSAEITFPNSSLTANKSLCASSLLPGVLQRTTSLPVDAVHI